MPRMDVLFSKTRDASEICLENPLRDSLWSSKERPPASRPSMRAKTCTKGRLRSSAILLMRRMRLRPWNWSARMPENDLPEPPLGSVWDQVLASGFRLCTISS